MRGIIIGGYASIRWFYYPLKSWLMEQGVDCEILPHGFFGWNVGDMGRFLGEASEIVLAQTEPIFLIGHSLGGLQSMWLASHFPKNIQHVFAIASPICGLENSTQQENFLHALNVTNEQFVALRDVHVPHIKNRITTVSSEKDIVCPANQCYIEGADNNVVEMTERERRLFPALSTHLVLPYLNATKQCILKRL